MYVCDIRKSHGVKLHDLGGSLTLPPHVVTIPSNRLCRIFNFIWTELHVEPFCWNPLSLVSRSLFWRQKKLAIIDLHCSPLTELAWATLLSKKYKPLTASGEKTATFSGYARCFWIQCCIDVVPNSIILFVYVPTHLEMGFIAEDDISIKIKTLLQRPLSEYTSLFMVISCRLACGNLAKQSD